MAWQDHVIIAASRDPILPSYSRWQTGFEKGVKVDVVSGKTFNAWSLSCQQLTGQIFLQLLGLHWPCHAGAADAGFAASSILKPVSCPVLQTAKPCMTSALSALV